MDRITVREQGMQTCAGELGSISNDCTQAAQRIDRIRVLTRLIYLGSDQFSGCLRKLSSRLGQEAESLKKMENGLKEILALYRAAEAALLNDASEAADGKKDGDFENYHVDSIVFDDEGSYGGDQGHMNQVYQWDIRRCWELLGYLREYYPWMTAGLALIYFSHLNSVGCGYVAMANTVFMEYENRPEEFERTFGYPMYKDGDLNYDRMILDIYATTDKAGYNDDAFGLPNGTYDSTRARIMEDFLGSKGVSVRTEADVDISGSHIREITENGGHLIIGYRNGTMYTESGEPVYINGGHAMTVTGVTEDGRYIVSSWGDKYYIYASDIDENDSVMAFYYD